MVTFRDLRGYQQRPTINAERVLFRHWGLLLGFQIALGRVVKYERNLRREALSVECIGWATVEGFVSSGRRNDAFLLTQYSSFAGRLWVLTVRPLGKAKL